MINNRKIVVLGAAESGVGAALLAQKLGWQVFVSDFGTIKPHFQQTLLTQKIPFEQGQHTETLILDAGLIIKSPGIPEKAPIVKAARQAGIRIISEIEFAANYTDAFLIAITGSNGKTTTTNLTYHLLKTAKLNVGLGGNVGYSFAKLMAENDFQYIVLELSSFQLDDIEAFKPHIAVLLNITPDHLDRYDYNLDNYIFSKMRVAKNQNSNDFFIINGEDENIKKGFQMIAPQAQIIEVNPTQLYTHHHQLNIGSFQYPTTNLPIKGKHNLFNAHCAVTIAKLLDIPDDIIAQGLASFVNAPHRMEPSGTLHGIEFINDSKATNVDAVFYALEAMTKPLVWIVGGTDKGNDYTPIMPLVQQKVKAIVCLGADNTKLHQHFGSLQIPMHDTQSAAQAVQTAYQLAQNGDTVLLSPACASFDLFQNYEDRGNQFKAAVTQLIHTHQA